MPFITYSLPPNNAGTKNKKHDVVAFVPHSPWGGTEGERRIEDVDGGIVMRIRPIEGKTFHNHVLFKRWRLPDAAPFV
ncbi:hypothetical protein JI741_03205 [Chryseolinea sp. Jin1]|uniref:Uncharacterized protein n=1 Tax=Chryseolinea lacunae TaxID=2801331 RepID=A0ABS1KL66_9BACT|nr:hypothetical protein [Chryseolinea lacunae]